MRLLAVALPMMTVSLGTAFAQIPDSQTTDGRLNCRFWNANDENTSFRLGLMAGYADLWGLAQLGLGTNVPMGRATYGEMRDGVTVCCSQPENGNVLILEALTLFEEKIAGASGSRLEALAAAFRKIHATSAPGVKDTPNPPAKDH